MNEKPDRPCCRALIVSSLLSSAVAALAVAFPSDAPHRLFATLPFLCVAWLAPGLLTTPFLFPQATAPERLLFGTGIAYVLQGFATTGARVLFGAPVRPLWVHALTAGVVVLPLAARLWVKPPKNVRRRDADDARLLLFVLALFAGATALFSGALYSDLSSDGIEAFEMGRSLDHFSFPRSPGGTGLVGLGVGMIAPAFPAHWFHLAFPHADVAPRLPLLLFLPLLFAGVVALAESGGSRRLGVVPLLGLAIGHLALGAAFGLNASFDPYHADLSSPGAIDVQAAVLVVGLVHAAASGSTLRLLLFATLAHLARPTGVLTLLLLAIATPLLAKRGTRAKLTSRIVVALVGCAIATYLYEKVYAPAAVGGDVSLGVESIKARLRYVSFFDYERLAWLLIPSGLIAPFAAFAFRSQDFVGRALSLLALATSTLFYFPSIYAPHHYVLPAVACSAALYRRFATTAPRARALPIVALIAAIAAFALAFPRGGLEPARPYRPVGETVYLPAPTPYENVEPALAAAALLAPLLEPCHSDLDPATTFTGSTLSIARYARREGPLDASIRFVYAGPDEERPDVEGWAVVAESDVGSLVARDASDVARVRSRTADVRWKAAALDFDRRRLFRHLTVKHGLFDLDLRALLSR
jgi:hypothetical protein